jgi:hypothetical protein
LTLGGRKKDLVDQDKLASGARQARACSEKLESQKKITPPEGRVKAAKQNWLLNFL